VVRLVQAGTSASVVETLATTLQEIDFDTVRRDLDRALAGAESDPEDAVTAACSVIESVCRSVLIELNLPLPARMDVQGLYRAIREPLGLSPGREDFPPEIANDIRGILGALIAMIQGIGALRTHAGDAHGRERGFACQICEFICPPRAITIHPVEIPEANLWRKVEKFPQ